MVHLVDPSSNHLWGKSRVVLWLMEAQRSSQKIEPKLVTFSPCRLSSIAADSGFGILNLESTQSRFSLTAVRTLQALLKESPHAVLHTHGYKPNIIGRLVHLVGGQASALISTCHGWIEDLLPLKFYNILDRGTSFLSDRLVVPDANMIESFRLTPKPASSRMAFPVDVYRLRRNGEMRNVSLAGVRINLWWAC